MKGRNPNSIVDNKLPQNEEKSLTMHIMDKLKRIDYTYNKVIENIEKKTEQMRKQHDKKAKDTEVKKESLVYVRIPRLLDREKCLKLQEVYSGPYIVCKFISKILSHPEVNYYHENGTKTSPRRQTKIGPSRQE